jgi:hypothetical protein
MLWVLSLWFCQGSRQNHRCEQFADDSGDRTAMICRVSANARK